MDKKSLSWVTVLSQPFGENSYIIPVNGGKQCIVVDPGFEPDKLVDAISNLRAAASNTPSAELPNSDDHADDSNNADCVPIVILNTHGHSDHIAGNEFMKSRWPDAPLVIGHGDAEKLTNPTLNLSAQYGLSLISPPADETVKEGDVLAYGEWEFLVLETPGHSAGHVVFVCKQVEPFVVIGGDVLFAGGVGRTDFPDGSSADLVQSIHSKLFTLPDDTIVLPGHGPATTIGREKEANPYVGAPAGYRG